MYDITQVEIPEATTWLRSPSWANEVDGEDVGVSGSGACPAEGSLVVLLYTVEVSLPGFEYLRGS